MSEIIRYTHKLRRSIIQRTIRKALRLVNNTRRSPMGFEKARIDGGGRDSVVALQKNVSVVRDHEIHDGPAIGTHRSLAPGTTSGDVTSVAAWADGIPGCISCGDHCGGGAR